VDPVIVASVIAACTSLVSVGATAAVAINASRTTQTTNTETVQAGMENTILVVNGARDDRIWDRRADTYVDALRSLHRTQTEREDMAHTGRFVNEAERQLEDWLASIQTSEWREIQARLLAYASQPVLDAVLTSERAIGMFRETFQNWKWIRDNVGLDSESPTEEDALSAQQRIRPTMEEATRRDAVLLEAIRSELHARPGHETALIQAAPRPRHRLRIRGREQR
jgi:hypothetical protein